MNNQDINTLITRSEAITALLNKALADGADSVVLPEGYRVEDLEAYKPERRYPRGEYLTAHWGDYLAYLTGQEENHTEPACFVDVENMVALTYLDHNNGTGHCKNAARYNATKTEIYKALGKHTNAVLKQRDLIALLEDWGDDITACDKDGEAIPTAEAVQLLQTLTVEKAKRIKQVQGDFEHERTLSEQAALKKEGRIVAELRITDPLYQGTEKPITVRYKLVLVVAEDQFALSLREIGAEANRRAKAEELVESAKKALHMPIYTGSYARH